jgi:hypothetical protein
MKLLLSSTFSLTEIAMAQDHPMRHVFVRCVLFMTFYALYICLLLTAAQPQMSRSQSSEALQQLLSMPAPVGVVHNLIAGLSIWTW